MLIQNVTQFSLSLSLTCKKRPPEYCKKQDWFGSIPKCHPPTKHLSYYVAPEKGAKYSALLDKSNTLGVLSCVVSQEGSGESNLDAFTPVKLFGLIRWHFILENSRCVFWGGWVRNKKEADAPTIGMIATEMLALSL